MRAFAIAYCLGFVALDLWVLFGYTQRPVGLAFWICMLVHLVAVLVISIVFWRFRPYRVPRQ